MKEMMKNTGILLAITLIAGLLLGLVYQVTKEPIAEQEAKAKQEACQEVFADAVSFEAVELVPADENAWSSEGYGQESIDEVMAAKDGGGSILGYVITVTTKEGYGGDIQFTMGVRADGTVNGISLLSISETAGLGMRAD
ncbi:MAG: FMN-binding protein [Lachnospiraceae bacterium]|nr:FMN-binding protein [Lachnospiraceae bacterium]